MLVPTGAGATGRGFSGAAAGATGSGLLTGAGLLELAPQEPERLALQVPQELE